MHLPNHCVVHILDSPNVMNPIEQFKSWPEMCSERRRSNKTTRSAQLYVLLKRLGRNCSRWPERALFSAVPGVYRKGTIYAIIGINFNDTSSAILLSQEVQ